MQNLWGLNNDHYKECYGASPQEHSGGGSCNICIQMKNQWHDVIGCVLALMSTTMNVVLFNTLFIRIPF